ncbi:MAG: peroxiredoxin family protein [Gemmatimonadota bacterium]
MRAYRDQYASLFHGGRGIVVLAVSADTPEALHSWARDEAFPQLFASDSASVVGRRYGAVRRTRDGGFIDNRTLYIIDADGRVAWRAAPFREIDPMAYTELGEALERIAPPVEIEEG